jgi:hypothetical protein
MRQRPGPARVATLIFQQQLGQRLLRLGDGLELVAANLE